MKVKNENNELNNIITFNFNKLNLRTLLINNEPYFCLNDACEALDIKNSRDVLNRLNREGVVLTDTLTEGGIQKLNYINESNLYRIIFRSDKPDAVLFQDWLFEKVLPQLRKTGSYAIENQTSQNPPSNSFPNLNPKNVINKQSIEAGEIQYFYLSNAEYLALPYFRWRKFKQRYLVCVDDYLLLTNFNTSNDANALRKFCQLTGCELEGFGKIDLFFCEFIYMIDFLNTKNNTLYNILRENLEVNFKKNIVDLINANLDLDLAVNTSLNNNLNNNLYTEQLLLAYQEERQETEELTIELGDKIRETEQLKDKVSEQEEIIKLFAEEINSRNTKLKIKANIVLNVNAVVFKTDYNHSDVYNYMYKQFFLMHPNVNWREEFFTSNNKLNYLMEKNINYLKELENLVLDLNLSQEYKQAVSR